MATPRAGRIIRAPGKLVANPQDPLATSTYPHGGVEIGSANMVVLRPMGQSYAVEYESTGEIGEILETGQRWLLSCFLRGWDDDAIEVLRPAGFTAGAQTQHAVFSVPGDMRAGTSELTNAVSLLFVPNDTVNAPGVLIYRAVPDWQDGAEIAFRRGAEFGIPMVFECLRDDEDRILQVGRIQDLSI